MRTVSVFIHHDLDDATRDHYARLRHFASGPIVAVSASDKRLPDGVSILDWPDEFAYLAKHIYKNPDLRARSTDLLLTAWFRNRAVSGDRYFVLEWDTCVNCEVDRWLAPVANYHVSGPSTRFLIRDPEWFWFPHTLSLPEKLHPYASGIVPFTCLCFSHAALSAISAVYPFDPGTGNGELRIGTVAHYCGYPPVANPNAGPYVAWQPLQPKILAPTIYHAVKTPVQPLRLPWERNVCQDLEKWVQPEFHVLDYGISEATIWLAERTRKVTVVEHSFDTLQHWMPLPPNIQVIYQPPDSTNPHPQGQAIDPFQTFVMAPQDLQPDLVLIDGPARAACARLWRGRATPLLNLEGTDAASSFRLRPVANHFAIVLDESDASVPVPSNILDVPGAPPDEEPLASKKPNPEPPDPVRPENEMPENNVNEKV